MRPGQKNRMRGGRGNNSGRRGPNPLTRSFESNGPDVKVRGTPQHIAEKYVQLARDAHSAGDTVMAEAYLQHAEHYYRIISAAQALQQAAYNQANGIPNPEQDQEEEDEFEVSGSDRFVFRTPQSFQQQGLGGPNFNEGSEQPMSGEGQPMAEGGQPSPPQGYGQPRRFPDRNFQDRGGQDRGGHDRNGNDRGGQDRGDRNFQDRGPRRFGRDRNFPPGPPVGEAQPHIDAPQPIIEDVVTDVSAALPSFITAGRPPGVEADEAAAGEGAFRPRRRRRRPGPTGQADGDAGPESGDQD
jgi:Domain of unknown function (DUF4167)